MPHVASKWVVVDVETSGLSPNRHRVLSLAVIVLDREGRVEGEFCEVGGRCQKMAFRTALSAAKLRPTKAALTIAHPSDTHRCENSGND
ncbi:MAG: hypothetical protein C0482_05110 [Gordonia sp.]|nr:hypothetical protein [Gordonia sp. (in: high G+C Gram-positive bacteria)]